MEAVVRLWTIAQHESEQKQRRRRQDSVGHTCKIREPSITLWALTLDQDVFFRTLTNWHPIDVVRDNLSLCGSKRQYFWEGR